MKRDICIIVHNYFPKDPRVLKQAVALMDRGYTVDVLCLRDYCEKKSECFKGIEVRRIPLPKKRGSKLRYLVEFFLGLVLFSFYLTILYLRRRYRIVQIGNIPNFYVFASFVPKLLGAAVVLDMHEIMPELFLQRYKMKPTSVLFKLLLLEEWLSVKYSRKIITVTDRLSAIIYNRNRIDKVTVVMNTSPNLKTNHIHDVHAASNRLKLIFHGTLTSVYRVEKVFQAIDLLAKKEYLVSFTIFGDGVLYPEIKHMVSSKSLEDSVVLKGFVPFHEISAHFTEYDLAVVPLANDIYSRFAFPTKISEYVTFGIPVLCSDVLCVRDYFDEKALIYFDVEKAAHLAEKLEYYIHNRNELKTALTREATRQNAKIDWQVMSNRYTRLMADLIAYRESPILKNDPYTHET
jgi:glycosyltransferase involved in cell wall biosynthesis